MATDAGAAAATEPQAGARVEVDASAAPWRAIGRINVAGYGHCTGVLVGARTVLTAGHCLFNRNLGRWVAPELVHFVAGYQRDSYQAHSAVLRYRLAGSDTAPPRGPGEPDLAVLELEQALDANIEPLPVVAVAGPGARTAQGGELAQAGYARDRAHVLTARFGCALLGAAAGQRVLAHGCATVRGDSGGPLLLFRGGRAHVLAINAASFEIGGQAITLAVPVTALAAAATQRDAAGAPGATWVTRTVAPLDRAFAAPF